MIETTMMELIDECRGSTCTTHDIRVQVEPYVLSEVTRPSAHDYRFAYRITMSNDSEHTVRLDSRHWIIVDADGEREDVVGDGVIGHNPRLDPGEYFTYTSMCPLSTPWGTMEGTYRFTRLDDGAPLDIGIERFYLAARIMHTATTST